MSQNQLYTAPSSGLPATGTQKSILSIGFIMLVVFGFFRPLSLTIGFFTVFGLSPFEIFGVGISYMLLIPVLLCFRNLRLDRTILLSIFFCLYCAGSVLWGSDVNIIATRHSALHRLLRCPHIHHRTKTNWRNIDSNSCRLSRANCQEYIRYSFRPEHRNGQLLERN